MSTQLTAQEMGLPFYHYFSSKEYDGGMQNYAISQNKYGIIYTANNFGLLEYDGGNWERYGLPNSTKIRDLYIENDGRIYVAGQGQLGYFRPNQKGLLEFISWIPKLPLEYQNIEEVWKVYKHQDDLIFCSFYAIFIFDQHGTLKHTIESKGNFQSFHQTNQQLYFQDNEAGLLKLNNGGTTIKLSDPDVFNNEVITGIFEINSGQLQIYMAGGNLLNYASQKVRVENNSKTKGISSINTVLRLKNGNIAIGTQYQGLFIFDESGQLVLNMDKERGLRNNTILSLFEDINGNLWIGHNNGISLLELRLPFRVFGRDVGINGTGYAAVQFQDDIYLGTNIHVKKISRNSNELSSVSNTDGQSYSFSIIGNDLLLGHNAGGFVLNKNEAIPMNGLDGVWNFLALENHPGFFLAGTYSGVALYQKVNDNYQFVRRLNGFNESSRLIQRDDYGNLWMSHGYKGIYKLILSDDLTSVEAKFYGNKEGLPTNLLNSVWKIGGRLIFTTEFGLYQYNQRTDKFEKEQLINSYFNEDILITSLVEDPVGNIFYIGSNEIGILEKQLDGTYQKSTQLFNRLLPLLNDDLQNISLLRTNEVMFAAKEGFIWYKKAINELVPPPYPTFIRSVHVTGMSDSLVAIGKNIDFMEERFGLETKGKNLVLPFNKSDIRFEFSNSIPNSQLNTHFRVRLDGLEEEFGDWSAKSDKEYTNLREGSYKFYVQSKDIYGQIGEAIPFTFSILPPWYRTSLAYFIYFLGSAVLLIGIFNRVDRRYQKKTKIITAKQQEELNQKETDLEISKQELARLQTEKLEAEIQSKNKELASATMHLLNKNEFIDHTKNQLSQIIKKSKNQEVKNELEKVINSIDKNIAEDNDWEQFEIHFDQVHGDFMERFKKSFPSLSPQEIKLSAYLRMNLSTKEIAHLMNISARGVEISRYRLRKKLNLERSENLQEFILKF
ncbi:two-component regulator propeller domain-containing protein [Mongoliitalea daihaiensis]|uniref:two-component regulator propeller domain-containing protein n=1 Tax=Mongoliitalea daihaiensis TaxID=2782006 RepID=UPI001F320B22|nr:two-component regulator propeller domain-containing protein [Mongoliitalea daihaiensis]